MRRLGIFALPMVVIAVASAQTAPPAASHSKPRVVRINIGSSCGWCGGDGYRSTFTTITPRFVQQAMANAGDSRNFPDHVEKFPITKQQWNNLVKSIDARALRAIPQYKGPRPPDLPSAFCVVEYSDRSMISLHYSPGGELDPVRAMKIPDVPLATLY